MPLPAKSLWPLRSALRALCVKSFSWLLIVAAASLAACSQSHPDPSSLTFLIESNPANLDPRFATDAQSQHLDGLLFSSVLERDEQMNLHADLAESWELPDPLTYVFHLRPGVRFHDGRPVNSADVKATFDYILNPANHSPKRGAFRMVTSIVISVHSRTLGVPPLSPTADFDFLATLPAPTTVAVTH